ncbi:upper zone of growth plate and cartilage matrix associated a precursor [Danio rerio]|uniref:Unique cartilage matrix-associated protein n=1 Tax=Danio rerio TaxID=7955 RepID=A4FVI5_DANRE|nr:upper zone of growth plate and cartilage matrix associated a precursor [Danio rerio]AAI33945.1 Zgc:162317 protein [Danio rerio]AEX16051.1 Gla-rich protein [Danio rerio]|eukprot:NP_001082950.1 unique cartilage matrix-associated protein precursor [Danio rerio]
MAWTHTVLLSLLPTVLVLIALTGVESAAVKDGKDRKAQGPSKQVFVPASDASNFFKRRARRSPKTYEEYYAEQRVKMSANERRREHLEEQSNEHENYLEEERDEQYERTRERNEQWREFNYDGQYPQYPHHRQYY